jgi:hypothetical protein
LFPKEGSNFPLVKYLTKAKADLPLLAESWSILLPGFSHFVEWLLHLRRRKNADGSKHFTIFI